MPNWNLSLLDTAVTEERKVSAAFAMEYLGKNWNPVTSNCRMMSLRVLTSGSRCLYIILMSTPSNALRAV